MEWDYSGKKGRDGQKKKISKAWWYIMPMCVCVHVLKCTARKQATFL